MKKTILIVDDEAKIRNTYMRILEKEGFDSLGAADAVEAWELVKNKDIDLVLLDLNMPEVGGEDLFQVMKAFKKVTKVIVASVYPIDEQKRAAPSADDFFDKSDGPKTLVNKIKFHLGRPVGKEKIIIIDDDDDIRSLYKRVLENEGYESECFGDCKSAVQFLKKKNNRFNLILLDISMPGLDVKDIFDIVREKHKEARVVIVSCHDIDHQEDVVPHADGYVDKSGGMDALLGKVEAVLSK